jgi:hypothetical protein
MTWTGRVNEPFHHGPGVRVVRESAIGIRYSGW